MCLSRLKCAEARIFLIIGVANTRVDWKTKKQLVNQQNPNRAILLEDTNDELIQEIYANLEHQKVAICYGFYF